jgi:hypothetical protein
VTAAAQIELGETVVRTAANATAEFSGGTIGVIFSSVGVDASLVGHGMQGRFITVRAAESAIEALGHEVDEGTPLLIASALPGASAQYTVRTRTNAPNTGTVLLELRA